MHSQHARTTIGLIKLSGLVKGRNCTLESLRQHAINYLSTQGIAEMYLPMLIAPLAVQDWGNLVLPIFLLMVVLLAFVGGPAVMARRQGYAWYCWIGTLLLGIVMLCCLPFANSPKNTPEENARLRKRGNVLGLLTTIGIIVLFIIRYLNLPPKK